MHKRTRASRGGPRGGRAALKVSLTSIASDEDTGDDAPSWPSCQERWDTLRADLLGELRAQRDALTAEMRAQRDAFTAELRVTQGEVRRIDRELREQEGKRMLLNAAFHLSVAAGLDWAEEAWIAADNRGWTN